MCGLSGIYTTNISVREKKVFDALMTASNLRGSQGSGVITAHRDDRLMYYKTLGNGVNLLNSKGFADLMDVNYTKSASTIIGHTRAPTKGGTDKDAVHPHDAENVIGVHNGTLYRVNEKTIPMAESDSKAAYLDISERGIDAFVQGAEGAYCLIWVNKDAKTLNFLRNSQRPLYFAKVGHGIKNNKTQKPITIFWSSEKIFLEFALARENFRSEEYIIEELPINTLVTYPVVARGQIEPLEVRSVAKVYPTQMPTRTYMGGVRHMGVSNVTPIRRGHNTSTNSVVPYTGTKQIATRWLRFLGVDPNNTVVDMCQVRDFAGSEEIWYRCTWSNGSISETLGFPDAKYITGVLSANHKQGVIDRKDIVPFDFSNEANKQKIMKALLPVRPDGGVKDDEVPFSSEAIEDLFVNAYASANVPPAQRLSKAEKRAQRRITRQLARVANKARREQSAKTMDALYQHMERQAQEDSNDACSVNFSDEIDPNEDAESCIVHKTYGNYVLSEFEFNKVITKDGCAWCTQPSERQSERHWFSRDEFLCEECHADEFARNYVGAYGEYNQKTSH
jgi:predicted glutamine amidotransferase